MSWQRRQHLFWIYELLAQTASFHMQASVLPPQAELVRGDVYQFSTLERAVADSNVMFIATGSRPAFDPFGPFNVDYQVSASDMHAALRMLVSSLRILLVARVQACPCRLQGVANLVEIGRRAKMKQIVLVSSIGADEPFFPLNLLWGVSHSSVSDYETVHGNNSCRMTVL